MTEVALEFIDTAGAGWSEELEPDGESRQNPDEARSLAEQAQPLLRAGVLER